MPREPRLPPHHLLPRPRPVKPIEAISVQRADARIVIGPYGATPRLLTISLARVRFAEDKERP